MAIKVHPSAEVSKDAILGDGTAVWNNAQIREHARLGRNCIISKNVYIDYGVEIGDNVKVQNNVSIYHGVKIEDGAFIGPHVCFTNDSVPRSINQDGTLKGGSDWKVTETHVKRGASIGANSSIKCGITIGEFALIGLGSVVTKDVSAHGLVYGNPAQLKGYVCYCGKKLNIIEDSGGELKGVCTACGQALSLKK